MLQMEEIKSEIHEITFPDKFYKNSKTALVPNNIKVTLKHGFYKFQDGASAEKTYVTSISYWADTLGLFYQGRALIGPFMRNIEWKDEVNLADFHEFAKDQTAKIITEFCKEQGLEVCNKLVGCNTENGSDIGCIIVSQEPLVLA